MFSDANQRFLREPKSPLIARNNGKVSNPSVWTANKSVQYGDQEPARTQNQCKEPKRAVGRRFQHERNRERHERVINSTDSL
mgnify:CR=1 FL=1